MTAPRPRRSVLYMPGSNRRAHAKGRTLPVDAVVLDLEDSIAPDEKEAAREIVRETIAEGGFGRREVVVRINPLNSGWGTEDLMAALAAGANAVMLPKVEGPDDVRAVAGALSASDATERVAIWAMMETPKAILRAEAIAATAAEADVPLAVLVMGLNDLAKETGAAQPPGRGPMLCWLSTCILAAAAYGLDILDSVYGRLGDDEGFRAECRQGAELGMDGKTLIHPEQIAAANEIFAPAADEVAWARRVLTAFGEPQNRGRGVIRLDGQMVELLHAEMAARTVAIADAIAAAND